MATISWDIIPATLRSLNDLDLSSGQIFSLLITGIFCITGTAIFYIKERNSTASSTTTETIGTEAIFDKETENTIDGVRVKEAKNGQLNVGAKIYGTDKSKNIIKNITVGE